MYRIAHNKNAIYNYPQIYSLILTSDANSSTSTIKVNICTDIKHKHNKRPSVFSVFSSSELLIRAILLSIFLILRLAIE